MFWARGTGATVAVGVLLVAALLGGGRGLQIDELRVPEAVRNGSASAVVLDCDYSLLEGDKIEDLVVKWYFNERSHPAPVYQWIPNKPPQVSGILKGRLNLEYRASDEPLKMYRALQISNPTPDLTGDYTCKVSTFYNETSQTKRLIVYVPERNLEVTPMKNVEDAAVNVTCAAEGVFPEPSIAIQRQERGEEPEATVVVQQTKTDEGLYDISASVVLEDKELTSPTTFLCELTIPEANYSARTSSVYMPGTNAACRTFNSWLLPAFLLFCWRL